MTSEAQRADALEGYAGSVGRAGPAAPARLAFDSRPATAAETAAHRGSARSVAPSPRRIDPDGVVAFEGRALGSALRLFVGQAHGEPTRGDGIGTWERRSSRAWTAVEDEFADVDQALSRFRADSELTGLNRLAGTGALVEVSWRMRTALAAMHRAARLTDGRFDASVLSDLERLGEHGATLEADPRPQATTPAPASGSIPTRPLARPSFVHAPDVPLDTGGIGKGLALRWAVARAAAIDPDATLLLDAGGDVAAGGRVREGGWRVGIEDPVDPEGSPVAVVNISRGAIATSSISVRNWTSPDGQRVHHLLDPRTGEPARTGLVAVTVAGSDPAWAEVWTKALFLAGRHRIGDEARSRGLAAWWVDDEGRLGMTPAARLQCDWVAEERLG